MKRGWLLLLWMGLPVVLLSQPALPPDPVPLPPKPTDHPLFALEQQAEAANNHPRALQLAYALRDRYPGSAEVYWLLAYESWSLRQPDLAVAYVNHAVRLDPSDHHMRLRYLLYALLANRPGNDGRTQALQLARMLSNNPAMMDGAVSTFQDWIAFWRRVGTPAGADTLAAVLTDFQAEFQRSDKQFPQHQHVLRRWREQLSATNARQFLQELDAAEAYVRRNSLPMDVYHNNLPEAYDLAVQGKLPQVGQEIVQRIRKALTQPMPNPVTQFRLAQKLYYIAGETDDDANAKTAANLMLEAARRDSLLYPNLAMALGAQLRLLKMDAPAQVGIAAELEALKPRLAFLATPLAYVYEAAIRVRIMREQPAEALAWAREAQQRIPKPGSFLQVAIAYAYRANNLTADFEGILDEAADGGRKDPYSLTLEGMKAAFASDFRAAVRSFQRASDNYPRALHALPPRERVLQMPGFYRNNALLAHFLLNEGRAAEAVEAVEQAKAFNLRVQLANGQLPQALKIRELQALLQEGEVLVYFLQPFPDEVLNMVVTRNTVQGWRSSIQEPLARILLRYGKQLAQLDREMAQIELREPSFTPLPPETRWQDVKIKSEHLSLIVELYRRCLNPNSRRDQVMAKPEVLEDLSVTLGSVVFGGESLPVLFANIHLIVVPDGPLSYIPLDALQAVPGQYFIERFNITYVQSGSVLAALQQRKEAYRQQPRKPVLAMGGALYEQLNVQPPQLQAPSDLDRIRLATLDDIDRGTSLRPVQVLFGGGRMAYLPGSLAEVQQIGQQVPDATLITGADMTETRLKQLSASGDLARYRWLHIATHGWVNPVLPEISGLAMCLRNPPEAGQDGFVVLDEVAKLRTQADMVVLSACQTGLGIEVRGEGVSGLTQALLAGGANATLSTLWPVSDAATAKLVNALYNVVFRQGVPPNVALRGIKRGFIRGAFGEEFKSPAYWAPFIYTGAFDRPAPGR